MQSNTWSAMRIIGLTTMITTLMAGFAAPVAAGSAVDVELPGFPPQADGDSAAVTLVVSSSDPLLTSMLSTQASITITQGDSFAYNGSLGSASMPLPATVELMLLGAPIGFPFGTYTFTIDAGDNFELYSAQVLLDQPQETVEIVLQVDINSELVTPLVNLLRAILQDIVL